jgi:Rad3-related DNA helicase
MTKHILDAFHELGYTPRDHQVQAVQDILEAFKTKKYAFLDAPTGSGKSLIAVVVQKLLGLRGVVVTATNALGEQYKRDYPHLPLIMGANQYPCEARRKLFKNEANADQCYRKSRFFYKLQTEPTECTTCEFKLTRLLKKTEPLCVTNYSYYIIDQLYIKPKPGGHGEDTNPAAFNIDLAVFDEAHLINEQFSQHYVIYYSEARSREFLKDIRTILGDSSKFEAAYESVFDLINENISRGSIGLANHMKFVDMLEKFYVKMYEMADQQRLWAKSETSYDQLGALYNKYHGLFCKIDDYKKYKYECVVDVKKDEVSLAIQPVYVGEASQHMMQRYNLFMSATLNYDFMVKTLALPPEECAYIRVGYTFNEDDKVVDFSRIVDKINYSNMYDEALLEKLRDTLDEILSKHQGESGVVITTSFKMAKELAKLSVDTHDIMVHDNSVPAKEIIHKFKSTTRPTVLLSPSLFEGVDLPDDNSRFQVLPKAPYLSLGSKRMFHISRKHRSDYLRLTIMRMVQAMGRSTRSRGDKSVTYILDKNGDKLFRSKHNAWKTQFKVVK